MAPADATDQAPDAPPTPMFPPSTEAIKSETFGPYEVYERLGIGGMAVVHRAIEHSPTGATRVVALKRLLPHLVEDESFVRSFVREAKLASMLNHPNIVEVFELGRVGGAYFISMEYIEGHDLRQTLKQARRVSGPPPIDVTVALLSQLCAALDYAHSKTDDNGHRIDLIHRDISPANLIITNGGNLKVIDFGIAKANLAHLPTRTGRIKGKLAYMAPEALAGASLDERADIFSAGVIAHELLRARPLFAATNDFETIRRVQQVAVPPPSKTNDQCPIELDALVLKALARDPGQRWQCAAAMGRALRRVADRYQLTAGPAEIAQWCDWLFAQPGDSTVSRSITASPGTSSDIHSALAAAAESQLDDGANGVDNDIVEVAWGGNERGAEPVVLDDVPDVSDRVPMLAAEGLLESDEQSDEQPTEVELIRVDEDARTTVVLTPVARQPGAPMPLAARTVPTVEHIDPSSEITAPTRVLVDQAKIEPTQELEPRVTFRPSSSGLSTTRATASLQTQTPPPMPSLSAGTSSSIDEQLPAGQATPDAWAVGTAPPPFVNVRTPGEALYAAALSSAMAAGAAAQQHQQVPGGRQRLIVIASLLAAIVIVSAAAIAIATRNAPAADTMARLVFSVEPGDATITIAGQPVDRSVYLEPGVYEIRIEHPGFESWQDQVDIGQGSTHTVHVALTRLMQPVAPTPPKSSAEPTPAPPMVRPGALKKKSGHRLYVSPDRSKRKEAPRRIEALLCVDADGAVTSATVTTPVPEAWADDLTRTMKGWVFEPYRPEGTAMPACFKYYPRVRRK